MAYTAKHRFASTSAKKIRPIARMIQGLMVPRALEALEFSPKRGAKMIEKVLRSAVANAGAEAEPDEMIVRSATVDEAGVKPGTKRWIPVSRGMAHPIRHRQSHITVIVDKADTANAQEER